MKFNLEKAVEKARFVIEKAGIPDVKAQVGCVLDVSGSARGLFNSGLMQEAFQQILPIGLLFDDNGEVDAFTFASKGYERHLDVTATKENYTDFLQRHVLDNDNIPKWGTTAYEPALKSALETFGFLKYVKKGFFGSKTEELQAQSSSGFPVVIYFMTDGGNDSDDKSPCMKLLQECQAKGVQIYVHFIGIGSADFSFIRGLGDKFDNTGFLNVSDIRNLTNEDVYKDLIPDELVQWFKKTK